MAWVDLCKVSDLSEGEGRFISVEDVNIAIFLKEGKVHVFDDTCPHAGASLSGGTIEEGFVTCPWHFWSFSVETGRMQGGGRARIRVYPVRIVGEGADAVVQADLQVASQERNTSL